MYVNKFPKESIFESEKWKKNINFGFSIKIGIKFLIFLVLKESLDHSL